MGENNKSREAMRIYCNSPREMIVKSIKVVTKMSIVQIRTPLRVKEKAINSHECGLPWGNQMASIQVVNKQTKKRTYFEEKNRM